MAKFVLIDQSLRSVGGHPCDYALHVLQAVERQGYTPVLATHWKFRRHDSLPAHWDVLPYFHHSSYSRYALCSSGTGLPPVGEAGADGSRDAAEVTGSKSFWDVPYRWHCWRRQAQLRHFVQACERVFTKFPLASGDHVFFATVSEFDFLALAQFFQRFPAAKTACWHLQFHFGIYEGRAAEYAQQQNRLDWVRGCFQKALGHASGIDLRFYNTSLPLVDQYNRLGMAQFEALPYPINPAMQPISVDQENAIPKPLRVTCGGGFRQEKGHSNLAQALSDVWEECFVSGQMQLQVQAKRSKWHGLRFPQAASGQDAEPASAGTTVKLIPHPLGVKEYVDLIRHSHIGLLMYDSRRYYARRAGVLCEFLCAGVPVVVPAGCWLSEQIAEAGFEYLDRFCSSGESTAEHLSVRQFSGAVNTQPGAVERTLEVPPGMGELIVGIQGQKSAESYVRIELDQLDRSGRSLATFAHVVGQRAAARPARCMWHVDPRAARVRVTLRDAFGQTPIDCEGVRLDWLPRGMERPLSCVGLIAADEQHFGRLVREIGRHYRHYRESALVFSDAWRREHDPALTTAHLTGRISQTSAATSRAA